MASILKTRRDMMVVLIILVPLTIFAYAMFSPHITHPNHMAHIAIHEAGMLIAGFLFSITIVTYMRTKIQRMKFSAAAFGVLIIAQGFYLFLEQDTAASHEINIFDVSEIYDISIVIMTMLFALGVFYNFRK
tara:strand:- start:161 stop:556 length:396 start_codon:yes stop_codon:yes gene_type:complete